MAATGEPRRDVVKQTVTVLCGDCGKPYEAADESRGYYDDSEGFCPACYDAIQAERRIDDWRDERMGLYD